MEITGEWSKWTLKQRPKWHREWRQKWPQRRLDESAPDSDSGDAANPLAATAR
jgi:hypothetical protein